MLRILAQKEAKAVPDLKLEVVTEALQYFGIPRQLWPVGLKTDHDVLQNLKGSVLECLPQAQALVDRICAVIAQLPADQLASQWWRQVTIVRSMDELLERCNVSVILGVHRCGMSNAFEVVGPNWERRPPWSPESPHSILSQQLFVALSIIAQRRYLRISFTGEAWVVPCKIAKHPIGLRAAHAIIHYSREDAPGRFLVSLVEVSFR